MELRQYRHVLALIDHASFRKAAEVLGISQPALTKSLFQIERDMGQRLFTRRCQGAGDQLPLAGRRCGAG